MDEKLTEAQIDALQELSEAPRPYANHWKPIQVLVRLGFAVEVTGLFYITDAGRAVLSQKGSPHE